jgi:hypothetical protein
MTYHWGCNKSNTTGVTSGAEIHIVVVTQGITGNSLLIGRALCRAMEHCCSCWVNVKQSLLFACCAL